MLSALGATMAMDHRRIAALIDELEQEVSGPLNSDWRELVRRLLYGLHSLLELHLQREDMPLWALLSPAERQSLHAHLTGLRRKPKRSLSHWPT
ncbi:MAG: hemerythrin domain-containing protein [Candidatus Dormibacteraeota bacterium]|uniref:Hemerythrin domain-containing protein n=1 Tax=Candidatus Dormiibacter inghamiae TaxID=3127013 RepID=A0A934KFW0_9BACT|nr:hemerythrin domain-containing protein [Candidatus Dormibacteraeota bacterium]MBJ7605591.1 hemerythrin domain-containing protein [Candidatus Dormibacteraeota bacterium]